MTEEQNKVFKWELVKACDRGTELKSAIEWIRKNISPDEVFTPTELRIFFEDNKDRLENKVPVPETQY